MKISAAFILLATAVAVSAHGTAPVNAHVNIGRRGNSVADVQALGQKGIVNANVANAVDANVGKRCDTCDNSIDVNVLGIDLLKLTIGECSKKGLLKNKDGSLLDVSALGSDILDVKVGDVLELNVGGSGKSSSGLLDVDLLGIDLLSVDVGDICTQKSGASDLLDVSVLDCLLDIKVGNVVSALGLRKRDGLLNGTLDGILDSNGNSGNAGNILKRDVDDVLEDVESGILKRDAVDVNLLSNGEIAGVKALGLADVQVGGKHKRAAVDVDLLDKEGIARVNALGLADVQVGGKHKRAAVDVDLLDKEGIARVNALGLADVQVGGKHKRAAVNVDVLDNKGVADVSVGGSKMRKMRRN